MGDVVGADRPEQGNLGEETAATLDGDAPTPARDDLADRSEPDTATRGLGDAIRSAETLGEQGLGETGFRHRSVLDQPEVARSLLDPIPGDAAPAILDLEHD